MHVFSAISQVDGRTEIQMIENAVVGKGHVADEVVHVALAFHAQTCTQGETTPAVRPVDIGIERTLRPYHAVGAQRIHQ